MATDPSDFVSIFSPGGTRLTLPPASPAGSEAGGVGSAQSSQTPAQQGAAGSVVQKILGGPSGSIGSVGGGSDTARKGNEGHNKMFDHLPTSEKDKKLCSSYKFREACGFTSE